MNKRSNKKKFGPEDLRKEVDAGQRRRFYLLYGEENFERELTAEWLVDKLKPDVAADFNMDVFRGDEFVIEDFVKIYQSYPMMAEYRLVIIKACDKLSQGVVKDLATILETPADSTVLIAIGDKVDMRRAFFQLFSKQGHAVEFRVPFDNQLSQWIHNYAKRQALEIEPEAIDLLNVYIGNNLRELAGELEKLSIYAGQGKKINRTAVEEIVGISRNAGIFELTDFIGQRDHIRSLDLLHSFLDQGEEPTRAVAMIGRHLQLLLKAQDLMQTAVPREQMAQSLGIAPFFLNNYLQQAQNYVGHRLWYGLGAVLDADAQLKSKGRKQQRAIMDLLVYRLCASGRAPRVDRML